MSEAALQLHQSSFPAVPDALRPEDIVAQVALVQQVMRAVMKEEVHFGKIPGCGDKPTLLLPGAQKLCLTFRLRPQYTITKSDLTGGHVEYEVGCELYSIVTGKIVGAGVGSCSSRETKHLIRSGPVEFTGKPVPKDYWDNRKTDPEKALKAIGGKGFSTKKNPDTGGWEVVARGEDVENPNPYDVRNTILKVAKKRSYVDATITATSCGDLFTQDLEDLVENGVIVPAKVPPAATQQSAAVTVEARVVDPASAPPPAAVEKQPPPPPAPEGEMDEHAMRDHLAMILSEIADIKSGAEGVKFEAGDVLAGYTANKDGKFAKRKLSDVAFTMDKRSGGTWSPLTAIYSKAKKDLETMKKDAEDEVAFG